MTGTLRRGIVAMTASLLLAPGGPFLAAQEACLERADSIASRGWEAFRRNQLEEARREFEEAVSRCPDHDSARTGLAYLHLRDGVTGSARVLFESVLESDPENVDALVGLGLLAWRSGNLQEVERRFRQVLDLLPGDPTARRYLGRVEDARRTDRAPDEADRAWDEGERSRSIRLYSARVAADSADVPALHRLALLRSWSGRHAEALELMDRLVEVDPSNVQARIDRARILAWSGDRQEALVALDAVLDDHPANVRALEAKAEILTRPDEIDVEGPERSESLRARRGAAPEAAFLGRPLVDPGPFREAMSTFDSLTAAEPDALQHRIGLGAALTFAGRYDSARAVLRGVLERSPGNLRAQQGLARALTWDGRLRAGERAWRTVVRTDPREADGWAGLAENLRWQGRPAAALAALERGREEAPGSPRLEDQMRWVRAALAPRVRGGWDDRDDPAEQRTSTTTVVAAWNPLPPATLRLRARRSVHDFAVPSLERSAQGALLTGSWEFEPGWTVTGGAGGFESDGARDPEQLRAQVEIASPPGSPVAGSAGYDRELLDRTALQVERSVVRERWGGLLRWRPESRWSVAGRGGWSEYRGDDRNTRWDASVGLGHHLSPRWSLGAGLRAVGFESDVADGYFDPDLYGLAELEVGWSRRIEGWRLEVEAAPGLQQIGEGADPVEAFRAGARLSYRLGPGRSAYVAGGYARNGLVSTATGQSDYDYRTFRIGGSWSVY